MKRISIHQLTLCGAIAGVYAVLTIATSAISYGPLQFRLSEALCILPYFCPVTALGLFAGCVLANLFSTVTAVDIVVGSAATLLAGMMTARCHNKWLAPLPMVFCNGLLVGGMLAWIYLPEQFFLGLAIYGGQVAFGELVVGYVLGMPLLLFMEKNGLGEKLRQI